MPSSSLPPPPSNPQQASPSPAYSAAWLRTSLVRIHSGASHCEIWGRLDAAGGTVAWLAAERVLDARAVPPGSVRYDE